jgi:hypothetical protein
VGLLLAKRVWLVRASAAELSERIQTACRGLFLGVEETPPGRLLLTTRGQPAIVLRRISPRVQLLILPRVTKSGKVALLCNWLAKTYPGPVPRIRLVLKRGES